MKKVFLAMAAAFFVTLLIPLFMLLKYGKYDFAKDGKERTVTLYVKSEDKVIELEEGQYLKEVVAAEMPASFELEALKAQAVAARSYLRSRQNAYKVSGPPEEHKGADMCTDPTHCKAWISEKDRRESWGKDADKNWDKIERAVEETKGEVITYNGEVISAVFHSTSSGKTESSKDVWGGERPYLVSVESPGDELSPKYKSEKEMSLDEFKKTAKNNIEGVDFEKGLIGDVARSDAGGILTIEIGGVAVKGTVFRKIYDLRSTNVSIKTDEKKVYFDVTGFGHGVGMSQYGANYLAEQGKTYDEILKTYYTGVELKKEE